MKIKSTGASIWLAALAATLLFLSHPSPAQQGGDYYGFAYFYGSEGTLLITPIDIFSVYSDINVSPKTQVYFYTRDNNTNFKNYIRSKYPDLVGGLTAEVETLIVEQDLAELGSRRDFMIGQSGDNFIELHDYSFKGSQFQKSQGPSKPQ